MQTEQTESWNVRGKTVLLTGGNAGIGKATVRELAKRGANVIFTSRDEAKGEAALRELKQALTGPDDGQVSLRLLDLASFQSIERFSEQLLAEVPALHVLVHNAGLIQAERQETEDGFELTFGTNHFGTFRLNQLLEERLRESAPARIVVVASNAHTRTRKGLNFADLQSKQSYNAVEVYSDSKLANILFTRELAKRLDGTGVTVNCLHPGVVASRFNSVGGTGGLWGFVFKRLRFLLLSPEDGAKTSVYLCCEPGLDTVTGAYFDKCKVRTPSKRAQEDDAAKRLWLITEQLCSAANQKA